MKILGLSFDFHDASAAVCADGRVLASCAEERLSLIKHDSAFPKLAIEACLAASSVQRQELDCVVFYEHPAVKFTRVLSAPFVNYPYGTRRFGEVMRSWLGNKLWVRNTLCSALDIAPRKIRFAAHHESHIAQAFCASGFDSAAVLVMDGVGEWACTTLAHAHYENGRFAYRVIDQYDYPQSIGIVYAAFTAFLGFKPNSGESSTMALAAFGRPARVDDVRKVFRATGNGYEVEPGFFDFDAVGPSLFRPRFTDLFGTPRDFRKPYAFDAIENERSRPSDEDTRCADIAASLQQVLSEVIGALASQLGQATGESRLCISGGVALNCVANSRLMNSATFAQIFVPPDPGDGGAAFGAAFACTPSFPAQRQAISPYLGPAYGTQTLSAILQSGSVAEHLASRAGLRAQACGFAWSQARHEDELIDTVVEHLLAGRIVAWFQGRFEIGPRALGGRSLLVHPGKLTAIRRLSRHVKGHTAFRPYALSMTLEACRRVIQIDGTAAPTLKWMQSVWPVNDDVREALRGGVHVDGTTRPQVCAFEDNPRYWKLLDRFAHASGVPALLNTSLNERSMPIVASPEMALAMFIRTDIDVLAMEDLLVYKTAFAQAGVQTPLAA